MTVRVFFDPQRVERLSKQGISPQRQLGAAQAPEARTALELVEECARLRADNRRLTEEVTRLHGEVARLSASGARPAPPREDLDDSAKRFSMLELDL